MLWDGLPSEVQTQVMAFVISDGELGTPLALVGQVRLASRSFRAAVDRAGGVDGDEPVCKRCWPNGQAVALDRVTFNAIPVWTHHPDSRLCPAYDMVLRVDRFMATRILSLPGITQGLSSSSNPQFQFPAVGPQSPPRPLDVDFVCDIIRRVRKAVLTTCKVASIPSPALSDIRYPFTTTSGSELLAIVVGIENLSGHVTYAERRRHTLTGGWAEALMCLATTAVMLLFGKLISAGLAERALAYGFGPDCLIDALQPVSVLVRPEHRRGAAIRFEGTNGKRPWSTLTAASHLFKWLPRFPLPRNETQMQRHGLYTALMMARLLTLPGLRNRVPGGWLREVIAFVQGCRAFVEGIRPSIANWPLAHLVGAPFRFGDTLLVLDLVFLAMHEAVGEMPQWTEDHHRFLADSLTALGRATGQSLAISASHREQPPQSADREPYPGHFWWQPWHPPMSLSHLPKPLEYRAACRAGLDPAVILPDGLVAGGPLPAHSLNHPNYTQWASDRPPSYPRWTGPFVAYTTVRCDSTGRRVVRTWTACDHAVGVCLATPQCVTPDSGS